RAIMRQFPEVELVTSQVGRPDDGTDPTGFYNSEFFVPLKPQKEWPVVKPQESWLGFFRPFRPRTKEEMRDEMNQLLNKNLIGIDWNFSQNIRDNVMEALSGVKGDNSVKIIGPDLDELEKLADQVKRALMSIDGVENPGVFRIKGQPNLEFPVDRKKCNR